MNLKILIENNMDTYILDNGGNPVMKMTQVDGLNGITMLIEI